MNNSKLLLLFLLVSFILNGAVLDPSPVTSSGGDIQTQFSIWPSGYQFLAGQTIQLEVSVWDENGQVVETGQITVDDLNGTMTVQTTVNSYLTLVSWTANPDGQAGIHFFEVTYSDPNGYYLSSSNVIQLLIDRVITEGVTGMDVQPVTGNFGAVKGQTIDIQGSLTSSGVFPYFYIDQETAYLSIEAEIEEGNWKILSLEYPSCGLVPSYDFNLAVILPSWLPAGSINSRCVFSGSYDSDLAATVTPFTIIVLSMEKSLVLIPQELTVERNNLTEQNELQLLIQVPGFDSEPVLLNIDLLALDGMVVRNLVVEYPLTSYSSQLSVDFSHEIPVGTYNLSAALLDQNTGIVIAGNSFTFDLIDDLMIDNFYWNVSDQVIEPGQKIQGYLVAREEDTFTGIKAQLKVKIDGMDQLLFNDTTGDSGYISFRLQIPGDLSPGSHVLDFRLSPLPGDLYHQECTLVKTAVIQEQTTIMHQQSSYLVRKQNSWFNATVVDSHGLPVNAGSLSLQLNGEIIHESTGSSTNYLFTVPSTVSRGINSFTWQYSGSEYYAAKEQVFPLAVFSVPSFENLGSSHGEIIPGDEIELTGQLVEETGDGIGGATVTVNHRDNWGNVTQYSVLTEAGGNFSFQLVVESENIGFHTFTLQFNGWTDEYYLPIEWKPVFEINVKLPITLIVKNQLVAGENASLEFQGKPSAEIKLEILDNGEFHKLSIFVLDSQGKYVYAWDIPENARGDIFLRAGYITSDEKVIFSLQVKVRPQIDLNVSKLLYLVDEEVEFLVSSSEKHDIWLDGEIWQDDLSAGSRLFTLVFTESGDHLLEVIASGEDVIETVLNASFLVREDYLVTINLPARVQRGVDIVAAIAIENSDKQPLEGFKISLFIDDQVMATAVTSQAGSSTMTFTLTTGFYRPVLKITPREEGIHYLKEIELEGLTVYSVPVIEISDVQPIKGRTVIVKIKVLDVLSPVAGETVSVLLKSTIDNSTVELGTNVTDMEGITRITWSVTQESGDYLLQVKNTGSQFVEPIITTKTVHINGQGPEIIQASVLVQEEQKNRYIVTAIIDFPGGKRGVYLYSGKNGEIIGELVETGSTWTLIFQLEKGSHDLWVQAVDNQDIDTWKDLGTVTVLTDLPESSESTNPGTTGSLIDTIRDTTITMVFILPVAGLIAYKKRKSYTRS